MDKTIDNYVDKYQDRYKQLMKKEYEYMFNQFIPYKDCNICYDVIDKYLTKKYKDKLNDSLFEKIDNYRW